MDKTLRLWIDGGTTNTRFTLTRGDKVVERTCRHVGATNADAALCNAPLVAAIRHEIALLEAKYGAKIQRICASGMITSPNGLYEVPHLIAPVGLEELVKGVQTIQMMQIGTDTPIDFIPGVRCGHGMTADVMRGEETEIMGWQSDCTGKCLFLHFGSHNKAILVQEGRIKQSVTTLSGELLYAVTHDTILRSAAGGICPETLLEDDAMRGFDAAAAHGATRALFEARLYAMEAGRTSANVGSFLIGILVQQDMKAFDPFLNQELDQVILYGQTAFAHAMQNRLRMKNIQTVPHESSEWLSFHGMRKVMRAKVHMNV